MLSRNIFPCKRYNIECQHNKKINRAAVPCAAPLYSIVNQTNNRGRAGITRGYTLLPVRSLWFVAPPAPHCKYIVTTRHIPANSLYDSVCRSFAHDYYCGSRYFYVWCLCLCFWFYLYLVLCGGVIFGVIVSQ